MKGGPSHLDQGAGLIDATVDAVLVLFIWNRLVAHALLLIRPILLIPGCRCHGSSRDSSNAREIRWIDVQARRDCPQQSFRRRGH